MDAVEKDRVYLSCFPDGVRLVIDLESIGLVEDYDEKYARSLMDEKIQKGREALVNRRISTQKKAEKNQDKKL